MTTPSKEALRIVDELFPDKPSNVKLRQRAAAVIDRAMQPLREAAGNLLEMHLAMRFVCCHDDQEKATKATQALRTALAGQPVTPSRDGSADLLHKISMLVLQRQTYDGSPELKRAVDDAIALRTALEMEKV